MKNFINNIKTLNKGTILRTILQVLVYINQVIALIGQTGFASQTWYQWLSFGVTLFVTAVSYWYNNDWTNLAKATGEIFDMVKDGKITEDELNRFINSHKKEG